MADELNIVCPAGEPIGVAPEVGGPGCRCRIEQSTLDRRSPDSIETWCAGDFTSCPSWRAMRDAEVAHREKRLTREIARTAG